MRLYSRHIGRRQKKIVVVLGGAHHNTGGGGGVKGRIITFGQKTTTFFASIRSGSLQNLLKHKTV